MRDLNDFDGELRMWYINQEGYVVGCIYNDSQGMFLDGTQVTIVQITSIVESNGNLVITSGYGKTRRIFKLPKDKQAPAKWGRGIGSPEIIELHRTGRFPKV